MPSVPDLTARINTLMRQDRGRLLAALIRTLNDFDLAEEALSDATERALIHWARSGLPDRPDAWLLQVARRAAIDRIRRGQRFAARAPEITRLMEEDAQTRTTEPHEIPDERLRLIFTCCHPALEEKTRVALTLRTVAGLSTREIARAFLDTEAAMGQRLSRAKAKIAAAGIPYAVPEKSEWDTRLNPVLTVIYLIFNAGFGASGEDAMSKTNLCDEGIWLARLLIELAPNEPEIEGLLALMLLTHARAPARAENTGAMVPLDQQNRSLWDKDMISEGLALLDIAMARHLPGPFQIQAAISALHVRAVTPGETDWAQILLLYTRLEALTPSPVVSLNRCVALAETGKLAAARRALDALGGPLSNYQPYHAARAELARRGGDTKEARRAYDKAIELSSNESERAWLLEQKASLTSL